MLFVAACSYNTHRAAVNYDDVTETKKPGPSEKQSWTPLDFRNNRGI